MFSSNLPPNHQPHRIAKSPASCIPSFLDQGCRRQIEDEISPLGLIRDPYNGFLSYPNYPKLRIGFSKKKKKATKSPRLFHCSGESQGSYPFWIENSVPEKPSKAQKCWVNPILDLCLNFPYLSIPSPPSVKGVSQQPRRKGLGCFHRCKRPKGERESLPSKEQKRRHLAFLSLEWFDDPKKNIQQYEISQVIVAPSFESWWFTIFGFIKEAVQ